MSMRDTINFGKQLFPTRTSGSGRVRRNSANDGSGQGRGSSKRIASCQQCGFPNDIRRIDIKGGDLSGDGARGAITKTTVTGTTLAGASTSDVRNFAAARKGGGCAFCFSKNSVKVVPSRVSRI